MVTSSVTGEIKRADTCRQQLGRLRHSHAVSPSLRDATTAKLRLTQMSSISLQNERTQWFVFTYIANVRTECCSLTQRPFSPPISSCARAPPTSDGPIL